MKTPHGAAYYNLLKNGEIITLRPFTEEDMDPRFTNYLNWFHDSDVTRYNTHGLFPYTKAAQDAFLKDIETGERLVFAIVAVKDHVTRLIGNVSLQSFNWVNRSAEFAIVIGDKTYWQKGIGKLVCYVVLYHGFCRLNLHRIWTGTAETNLGMNRLALNLGMAQEGKFRDAAFLQGIYTNISVYGILQEEFLNRTTWRSWDSVEDAEGSND